ncbi:WXG100 family type VII secretion target [Nocardia vinacea]|uniref:WXG100 family type VII secretion target n=1 Tax=Nocardia vinacea TaxID=96468 RepID=UPI003415705D
MAESLRVDLDAMRAASSELDQAADEVARMVADLKADLAREGEFWGDDEPGKMIAESYVPGADRAMEGMENLVAAVRSMQSQLASAADTYSQQDLSGAQQINNADPTTVSADPGLSGSGGYQSPISTPTAGTTEQPVSQGSTPVNLDPATTDRQNADDSAAQNNAGQAQSAQSPSAQSSGGQSDTPTDNSDSAQDGNGGTDASQTPADNSDSAGDTAGPGSTTTNPAASNAAANPTATSGARANPVSAKGAGSAARTGSAAGTPWSGNPANTPWSKSPATSSPTSPPSNGAPPRISPPRPGGRPGADKDAADKGKQRRPAPQRAVPQRAETDNEAMRIAREMAARHNLEIRGFETAGIHETTVREMAAALDAVLSRYTLPLYGIEITDLSGAPVRVENRNTATESDDPAPWIVLDRTAAANSHLPGVTAPRSPNSGRPERAMYATTVRGLGGAMDIAGGFRARTEAQRTLITEYLRVRGAKGDTLARVVSGYKRWRGGLSDNCFHNGVFAPAAALAEAFAAVELDGEAASGPAKALHRLLVQMARASIFDE